MRVDSMSPHLILFILAYGAGCIACVLIFMKIIFEKQTGLLNTLRLFFWGSMTAVFLLCFLQVVAPTYPMASSIMPFLLSFGVLGVLSLISISMIRVKSRNYSFDFWFARISPLKLIKDSIFIFDKNDELAAFSLSDDFPDILPEAFTTLSDLYRSFTRIPALQGLPHQSPCQPLMECSVQIKGRRYHLTTTSLGYQQNETCTLLLLQDTTKENEMLQQLIDKNAQIDEINRQLLGEMEIKEALIYRKERDSFIKNIQDEIHIKIEEILHGIESFEGNPSAENLRWMSEELRALLSNIRKVVNDKGSRFSDDLMEGNVQHPGGKEPSW